MDGGDDGDDEMEMKTARLAAATMEPVLTTAAVMLASCGRVMSDVHLLCGTHTEMRVEMKVSPMPEAVTAATHVAVMMGTVLDDQPRYAGDAQRCLCA